MLKSRMMFGATVLGALTLMFACGMWIGGVSTGEAQCLPIKLVSCGNSPCTVINCGPGIWAIPPGIGDINIIGNNGTGGTVRTFNTNFLGLCMGR